MASYASLAGVITKRILHLPLLITLADHDISTVSPLVRGFLSIILNDADQVYGTEKHQEKHAKKIIGSSVRHSMGEGDAFVNQLSYAYAEGLMHVK
jgi:hypothetical protein